MAFCIYLDHADVVYQVFAIEIQEERVEPDRTGLIFAAGVASDCLELSENRENFDQTNVRQNGCNLSLA